MELGPVRPGNRGFWTAASLGFGASTLLGGIIYQLYPVSYLFILGALFGYTGCLSVILLNKQGLTSTNHTRGSWGYTSLLRQHNILILCTVSIITIIATSAFNSFFTVYLVDSLGASKLVAVLAATGTTLLGALAFKFIGLLNDKVGRKPVFMIGTAG